MSYQKLLATFLIVTTAVSCKLKYDKSEKKPVRLVVPPMQIPQVAGKASGYTFEHYQIALKKVVKSVNFLKNKYGIVVNPRHTTGIRTDLMSNQRTLVKYSEKEVASSMNKTIKLIEKFIAGYGDPKKCVDLPEIDEAKSCKNIDQEAHIKLMKNYSHLVVKSLKKGVRHLLKDQTVTVVVGTDDISGRKINVLSHESLKQLWSDLGTIQADLSTIGYGFDDEEELTGAEVFISSPVLDDLTLEYRINTLNAFKKRMSELFKITKEDFIAEKGEFTQDSGLIPALKQALEVISHELSSLRKLYKGSTPQ